jgi:hypothetical protein
VTLVPTTAASPLDGPTPCCSTCDGTLVDSDAAVERAWAAWAAEFGWI